MFTYPRKIKYPTENQIEIWALNRDDLTGIEIAKRKKVSPAFVSKTLKKTNGLVKDLLENAARMNKIKIEILSGELGFARGMSHVFIVKAYITFSPENGVQVWYEHKGDCGSCEEFVECRAGLIQEFKERNIRIPNSKLRPTDLGDLLFKKIEEMLE
ncbi:MAG: hypothetical protein ACXABU_16610 [Candidatus Hodarchaeales archaeon]